MTTLAGLLTLPENLNYHRMFEYAGAGEIWQFPEQTIKVFHAGYWFLGKRKGVRIDSWCQSRTGAYYESDNRDTSPTEGELCVQYTSFDLAKFAKENRFIPAESWEIKEVRTYSTGDPMFNLVKS